METGSIIDQRENCDEKMDQFLKRCFYHSGQYDFEDEFAQFEKKLKEHELTRVWKPSSMDGENTYNSQYFLHA